MDAFARHLAGFGQRAGAQMRNAIVTGLTAERDTVVINYYGRTVTSRKVRGYVPSVGDVVKVFDDGGSTLVLDSLGPNDSDAVPGGSGEPSIPPPQPGRATTQSGVLPLVAQSSMTWRSGQGWMTWDHDLYQGTGYGYGPHKGLWFYGGIPQTSLAGAIVTACSLYVPRRDGGGDYAAQTVHVFDHGYASRPAGDPAMGAERQSVSLGRGEGAWIDIAPDVGQALVDGTISGFGIANDPYVVVSGVGNSSSSGALQIAWRK